MRPEHIYTVVTTNFVAEGRDGYNAFIEAESREQLPGCRVLTCMQTFLEKTPLLSPTKDGRLESKW